MDINNEFGLHELHDALTICIANFHKKCIQYGIKYSVGYGTMLGAVREHGIIPWDDDIDIIIDRKNYNLLLKYFTNDDGFYIGKAHNNALWIDRIWLKQKTDFKYAPTIDIFVIDHVPDNKVLAIFKDYVVLFVQGMLKMNFFTKKGNLFEKAASFLSSVIGAIFPTRVKLYLYKVVSTIGNNHKTSKVANYNGEYLYVKKRFDKGLLDELIEMPFESTKVYVSKKYDSYLSTLYGDYMTPPKDKSPKHIKG